jgi:hypothetical protein
MATKDIKISITFICLVVVIVSVVVNFTSVPAYSLLLMKVLSTNSLEMQYPFPFSSPSSFRIKSPCLFPSEWIWNYGSYRQSVGLLGRVINPVARSLSTQKNTKTQTRRDIFASSGIRTYDPSVQAAEDISCLRPRGHCDRLCLF